MNYKLSLFAVLAILMASCSQKTEIKSENIGGHNHKIEVLKLTAYSNQFEVFAEADAFVIGKSSNILAHFSNLPDFTALENANVTIRLIVDGKEIRQSQEKPLRKGIFKFLIKPETEGKGKLFFDIISPKGNFQVTIPDIVVYSSPCKAAAEHLDLPTTNTTVFTKEQSWKIDFATEFPIKETFGQVIKTTALIQSAQGDEVLVTAKTAGIVVFSKENILEGVGVDATQTLFSISGSGLVENNSTVKFMEAKNNFEKANTDYQRAKELAKEKIVSQKELLNAKNDFENTRVVFQNLKKNINSSGQNVSSPMSGFVKQLFVENGEYVEAGQAILSVSQNKTLLLTADVQQKYVPILSTIKSANIRTLHNNKTYSLEELNGKVISFGKTTNTNNYLIPISLQIDNRADFVAGSFVEVYLKSVSNQKTLTIPNTSILEEQGSYFVFVQITPELFEKRQIKTGQTDGLKTEILNGISVSERIISRGAMLVKLAQSTSSLDPHSGHVH